MDKLFNGIEEFFKKYADEIQSNINSELSWTTNLKNDITFNVDQNGLEISGPLYGLVIDKGRRAGAKMPPIESLYSWMKSKSIPLSAAFPIARKIGRDGIPAKPWIEKSAEISDDLLDELAELLANNILDSMSENIEFTVIK